MRQLKKGDAGIMNILKLKGLIVANGMNVEQLADAIGIDRSSMYRKLNSFEKITIGEANKIKECLNMSDEQACDIFFSLKVACDATEGEQK
jgi:predicted transcriptional regulator